MPTARPEARVELLGRVEVLRRAWSRAAPAERREIIGLLAARVEVVPAARKFSHEVPAPRITWRTVGCVTGARHYRYATLATNAVIGARLRAAREKKGLTIRALADVVKLSHVFVGEIERGTRRLPAARRAAFAVAVGLPAAMLTPLDPATLEVVSGRLAEAGGRDRAVRLVRAMAGGGR